MKHYELKFWFYFIKSLYDGKIKKSKESVARKAFWEYFKNVIKAKFSDNLKLLYDKMIPIFKELTLIEKEKSAAIQTREIMSLNEESIVKESKKYFLEAIKEQFDLIKIFNIIPKFNKNHYNEITKNLKNQGFIEIFNEEFGTQSRLIIGLGGISPLETSITLHHTYGIPYIPGTALKGVVRAYAFYTISCNFKGDLQDLQEKFYGEICLQDKDILEWQILLGSRNFKGLLLFLDAFPVLTNNDGKILDIDIINVHYPKYYGEESPSPPGEWEDPRPIFFLTIKKGVKFKICVLFDKYRYENLPKEYKDVIGDISQIKEKVNTILKEALDEMGIGAKTRLGYGTLML